MNILVIGTEKSIHDYKWISFLARHSEHRFFFISERPNRADKEGEEKYKAAGVTLLEPLPPFSLSSLAGTYKGFRHLHRMIAENGIDMVHVIFPTPHLYWMSFSKLPVLVSTRGSDVLVVIRSLLEGKGIKEKILLSLMEKNLRKVHAVTCTSEPQEEFLCIHFPFLRGKTKIVRTGINIGAIEKMSVPVRKPEEKKIIFSPRFFLPIYNILAQIEALQLLPESLQRTLRVIFVRGKTFDKGYEAEILSRLSSAQFDHEIRNYLSVEEMVAHYKNADLVLMTPLSDGTPNSALEAMVCRTPLIVSDLDYRSPLFSDTCLKADPHDAKDIAMKIRQGLYQYPFDTEKAYDRVRTYADQKIEMAKIAATYVEIFGNK